jgi:hypothetical protein
MDMPLSTNLRFFDLIQVYQIGRGDCANYFSWIQVRGCWGFLILWVAKGLTSLVEARRRPTRGEVEVEL